MSQGGPPVSFKTNVNRMKTKRWVEAKSYNYDGDDWGDADEYDDYGEPEPEPAKPTGVRQAGQPSQSIAPAPRQGSLPGAGLPGSHQQQQQQPVAPPQAPYARPPHERQSSYGRGDDQLAPVRPGAAPSPRSHSPIVSPIRTAYSQAHPLEQATPQSRGHTPSSSRGPFLGPNEGSRTQSMTSNTPPNRPDPSLMQPQPPFAQNSAPRKNSFGQQAAPTHFAAADARPSSSQGHSPAGGARDRSDSGTRALPFTRPADIYKRMHEEKEKLRQSQESSRTSLDGVQNEREKSRDASPGKGGDDSDANRRAQPRTLSIVPERQSEYTGGLLSPTKLEALQKTRDTSISPKLPEIGGFGGDFGSDFGSSFMSSQPEPTKAATQSTKVEPPKTEPSKPTPRSEPPKAAPPVVKPNALPQEVEKDAEPLKHAPSQGYRSAVHLAFDQPAVPGSPTSAAASSFGRSNSESTSAISPIISRGPSDAQPAQKNIDTTMSQPQFPPISEEPNTPDQAVTRGRSPTVEHEKPPNFVPGHRRNMSTPSPDNSPARKPNLETPRALRQPQEIQIASRTNTGSTNLSTEEADVPPVPQASQQTEPRQMPQQLPLRNQTVASIETASAPRSGSATGSERAAMPAKGPTSAPAVKPNQATPSVSAGTNTPQETGDESEVSRDDDQFAKVEPLQSKPATEVKSKATLDTSTPQKLPNLSTASSPADQESDRLRKEIVRELSPNREDVPQAWPDLSKTETVTSAHSGDATRQGPSKAGTYSSTYSDDAPRKDSSTLVDEYAKFFASDSYDSPQATQPQANRLAPISDIGEYTESPSVAQPPQQGAGAIPTNLSQHPAPNAAAQKPPALGRKFSWEADLEGSSFDPAGGQPPPLQTQFGGTGPVPNQDPPGSAGTDKQLPAQPPTSAPAVESNEHSSGPSPATSGPLSGPMPPLGPTGQSARAQPFRDVLSLRDHETRLRSYMEARQHLAAQDSGMETWLQSAETLAKTAPPPGKPDGFTRRPSNPMLQQSGGGPYQPSGPVPPSGVSPTNLTSSPSSAKLSSQQMQAKGKDLLHTAGVFGGKANVAAKGLLAKGRKKLRDAADRDKAPPKPLTAPSVSTINSTATTIDRPPAFKFGSVSASTQPRAAINKSTEPSLASEVSLPSLRSPPLRPVGPNSEVLPLSPVSPTTEASRSREQLGGSTFDVGSKETLISRDEPIVTGPGEGLIITRPGESPQVVRTRDAPFMAKPGGHALKNESSPYVPSPLGGSSRQLVSPAPDSIVSKESTGEETKPDEVSEQAPVPKEVKQESAGSNDQPSSDKRDETDPVDHQNDVDRSLMNLRDDETKEGSVKGKSEAQSPAPAALFDKKEDESHRESAGSALAPSVTTQSTSRSRPALSREGSIPIQLDGAAWDHEEPMPPPVHSWPQRPSTPPPMSEPASSPEKPGQLSPEQIEVPLIRAESVNARPLKATVVQIDPPKSTGRLTPDLLSNTGRLTPDLLGNANTGQSTSTQPQSAPTPQDAKSNPVEEQQEKRTSVKTPITPQGGLISPSQRSSRALGDIESKRFILQTPPPEPLDFISFETWGRDSIQPAAHNNEGPGTFYRSGGTMDVPMFESEKEESPVKPPALNLLRANDPGVGPSKRPFSFIKFENEPTDLSLTLPLTPQVEVSEEPDESGSILADKDIEAGQIPGTPTSGRAFDEPDLGEHPAFRNDPAAAARASRERISPSPGPISPPSASPNVHDSRSASATGKMQTQAHPHPPSSPLRPSLMSRPSRETNASSIGGEDRKRKKRTSIFSSLSGTSDVSKRNSRTIDTSLPIDPQPDLSPDRHPGYRPAVHPDIKTNIGIRPAQPSAFMQRKLSMGSEEEKAPKRSISRQLLDRLPGIPDRSMPTRSKTPEPFDQSLQERQPKKRRFSNVGGFFKGMVRPRQGSRGGPPPVDTFPHIRSQSQASYYQDPQLHPYQQQPPYQQQQHQHPPYQPVKAASEEPASLHQRQQSYATHLSKGQDSGPERSNSQNSLNRPGTASSQTPDRKPTYSPFPHQRSNSKGFPVVLPPQANVISSDGSSRTNSPVPKPPRARNPSNDKPLPPGAIGYNPSHQRKVSAPLDQSYGGVPRLSVDEEARRQRSGSAPREGGRAQTGRHEDVFAAIMNEDRITRPIDHSMGRGRPGNDFLGVHSIGRSTTPETAAGKSNGVIPPVTIHDNSARKASGPVGMRKPSNPQLPLENHAPTAAAAPRHPLDMSMAAREASRERAASIKNSRSGTPVDGKTGTGRSTPQNPHRSKVPPTAQPSQAELPVQTEMKTSGGGPRTVSSTTTTTTTTTTRVTHGPSGSSSTGGSTAKGAGGSSSRGSAADDISAAFRKASAGSGVVQQQPHRSPSLQKSMDAHASSGRNSPGKSSPSGKTTKTATTKDLPPLQTSLPLQVATANNKGPSGKDKDAAKTTADSASTPIAQTPEQLRAAKKEEIERSGFLETQNGTGKEVVRTKSKKGPVVDGEVIHMSSTAYPGQEWRPEFISWD